MIMLYLIEKYTLQQKSYVLVYRLHTTVKNARNMKSVSQAKQLYFEGIVKL